MMTDRATRHCERSEAIHVATSASLLAMTDLTAWIAASPRLLAMTSLAQSPCREFRKGQ
jgi:hypothetical protein